jgi:hypothetical protein
MQVTRINTGAREATAYHEAGHAVIALRVGFGPSSATIIPTRDSHGSVVHANPLRGINMEIDGSDRARLRVERAIKICLAGPLAQKRFKPHSYRRWHGREDFNMAADLALRVCGSGRQASAFLKWLDVTTREMIEMQWPGIVRLANRLLKEDHLGYSHVVLSGRPYRSSRRRTVRWLPMSWMRCTSMETGPS